MVLLAYQNLRQAIDVLCKGGRIAYLNWTPGNLEQLVRAARKVRPTVMGGMPSLFSALQNYRIDPENLLGNRLRMVVIGGARSTPELKKWIFSSLSAICLDGYGSTETGGISLNGESNSDSLALIDCPALGYMTSDLPHPRGEIVSKISARTTPGYYKNEQATNECIIEVSGHRYWRTGDIGMRTESGIVVIDRAKNFFKVIMVFCFFLLFFF